MAWRGLKPTEIFRNQNQLNQSAKPWNLNQIKLVVHVANWLPIKPFELCKPWFARCLDKNLKPVPNQIETSQTGIELNYEIVSLTLHTWSNKMKWLHNSAHIRLKKIWFCYAHTVLNHNLGKGKVLAEKERLIWRCCLACCIINFKVFHLELASSFILKLPILC